MRFHGPGLPLDPHQARASLMHAGSPAIEFDPMRPIRLAAPIPARAVIVTGPALDAQRVRRASAPTALARPARRPRTSPPRTPPPPPPTPRSRDPKSLSRRPSPPWGPPPVSLPPAGVHPRPPRPTPHHPYRPHPIPPLLRPL